MEITSFWRLALLLLVAVAWIYFRLLRSGRNRKKTHGRELWRDRLQDRRTERLKGAATWEERRARLQGVTPERKIAERYLKSPPREEEPKA